MRHRVNLERPEREDDAIGQSVVTWATHIENLPCNIQTTAGKETTRGDKNESQTEFTFTTRYNDTINTTMRIKWNGRTFNIDYVADETGLRRDLTIKATETL